jgi:hypothetical protein
MPFGRTLSCSLACAGFLAIPASARALDTGLVYDASIPTTAPNAVGTVTFARDSSNAGQACRYAYTWIDPAAEALTARGLVLEPKTQGFSKCLANSRTSFPTFVQIDPSLPSEGFDLFHTRLPVLVLALGETPSGELSGSVQLTAAVPTVYSLDLTPRP